MGVDRVRSANEAPQNICGRLGLGRAGDSMRPGSSCGKYFRHRWPLTDESAFIQNGEVRKAARHNRIVDRGHNDSVCQQRIHDESLDFSRFCRVRVVERIVVHEYPRFVEHRPGDQQSLCKTRGKRIQSLAAVEASASNRLVSCQSQGLARKPRLGSKEVQEFVGSHTRPSRHVAGHVADQTAADRRVASDGVTHHGDVAAANGNGRGECS